MAGGFDQVGKSVDAAAKLMNAMEWALVITTPLAFWQLIDICLWFLKHLQIGWQ